MITAYAQREIQSEDPARCDFERGRLLLIERIAAEFDLSSARELDVEVEYLYMEVDLDFENDSDPAVGDLIDRFTGFLHALEDRGT